MSTKLIPPRSRMTSEERRAAIIHSAFRLFADKGFRGTTTRELAAAVGVTEPVLYEHFKTKRDLYAAIIGEKSQEGLATIENLRTKYLERDDDEGYFLELGNIIIDWYTHDSTFIRLLLFSSLENHELKEAFNETGNEVFKIISDYIDRRMKAGALRAASPQVAARAFFGMVAHYAQSALVFECAPLSQSPKEVVSAMVSIFLKGLCNEDGK